AERAARGALRLVAPTEPQRARRARDRDVPQEARQPAALGERLVAHEPVVGGIDVAELEQVGDPPGVSVHRDLELVVRLGERDLLGREREALPGRAGLPESEVARAERRRERRRVAGRAREAESFVADREAAVAVDEVELARERREDERERGRVVGADRARGLLEEADHGVIWLPRFRSRSARDPG